MGQSPARENTTQSGAGTVSAEAMARVGKRIGDYQLKGVIGEGGTGVVYRGGHVASDRPVAIKILHDRGARQNEVVEQFLGEARTTSRIHHTNVIDVLDFGTTPDGTVFLVMELLEGESLRSRLRSVSRLPLFEAINILRQVARGLGAAHAAGMVHGGLKPADIFLCKRAGRRRIVRRSRAQGMRLVVEPEESFDLVKLLDFGMARFLDLAPGAQAPAGSVSGTLHYLSPEQAQGQPADLRSDIYALGAVFYEMVTGAVPFDGESLLDILRGHVSGQVIAPSRRTPGAGIHMRIDALILRCLKKNPALRFAATGELCEALGECVSDCAFLRDAHRLPGIMESGIDLSQTSPESRLDRAPVAKPAATQVVRRTARAPLADDPAATVITPPPTVVVAEVPAEISTGVEAQPTQPTQLTQLTLVRPDAIIQDVDDHPAYVEEEARPRRIRKIALAGVMLLGAAGIAVWAAPGPRPAPSPPPRAVPLVVPIAPVAVAPVIAPVPELPKPEPSAPVEMAKITDRDPGKVTVARTRPTQLASARRGARVIPGPPETAPTAEPQQPPPTPASAEELVREAQHGWMRGHHAVAISKAQDVLKAEPTPAQAMQAYELIATCSCAIGKANAAREAASHLGASKRELVKTACMKNGVTIE